MRPGKSRDPVNRGLLYFHHRGVRTNYLTGWRYFTLEITLVYVYRNAKVFRPTLRLKGAGGSQIGGLDNYMLFLEKLKDI